MSKLEEREAKRKAVIRSFVAEQEDAVKQAEKERRKRICLAVRPSLYADVQKIAYVQRRSVSKVMEELMEQFRESCREQLDEYEKIKK